MTTTRQRPSLPPLIGASAALIIAASTLPAAGQVDEETFAAAEDAVLAYTEDMNRATLCIYVAGAAFSRDGEDVFDTIWGTTAVAVALAEVDDFSDDQTTNLVALFQENFSVDFAVADIRKLTRSCYFSDDGGPSIQMQLMMFDGVGVPFTFRLERALD